MSLFRSGLRTGVPGVLVIGLTGGLVAMAPPSAADATTLAKTVSPPPSAGAKPNSDVRGKPARYEPKKLSVLPSHGKCTSANYSFSITNKTAQIQRMTEYGAVAAKIKPGQKWLFCSSGPKGAKMVFGLRRSGSHLSVVLK
jgi:hypothetical protein